MKRTTLIIIVMAVLAAVCGAGEVGSAGPVTLAPVGSDDATGSTTTTTNASTTTTVASDEPTVTTTIPEPTDESTSVSGDSLVFVDVFFVKGATSAQAVTRSVEGPMVATNAIQALIEGPTEAERAQGLSTAVPEDTLLLGIGIVDGLATIDLSREFEIGGGSFNILSRLAQVVYTLTQFPTVDAVNFRLDGEAITVFSGEGVVLENPVDRADYETILPIATGTFAAGAVRWGQDDLPSLDGADPSLLSRIVLIEDIDVLNVRVDPGIEAAIVGTLSPDVVVERTGLTEVAGSSIWAQIVTPVGSSWVDARFLGASVGDAEFRADDRITDLLNEFAAIIAARGDLRPVTSQRGLYVAHNAAPIRFARSELEGILSDPTTYQWPSNIVSSDDPDYADLVPARTFAEAVGDSFLGAFHDPDTTLEFNEWLDSASRGIPEAAIPITYELRAFNYVGVHDGGDDPGSVGIDWVTWYVSFDYENGEPRIVALTIDTWTP